MSQPQRPVPQVLKGTPTKVSGAARAAEALVDLNFKVPRAFRKRFKQLALDADLKNVQLLARAVDAFEREERKGHAPERRKEKR